MTAHISTDQIVNYIKTVKKVSVDGIIYDNFTVGDKALVVDKFNFPFDYFDVGGMDPNSLVLVGVDHEFHRVQFHDENNVTLNHPEWNLEEYDFGKVRNTDIIAIARKTKFDK
jgi:hypothetical protein